MHKALAGALFAAVVGWSPWVAAQPKDNTIAFENCTLELPGTTATALARCGGFEVPEDPAAPDGRKIRLKVAVAPASGPSPEPDPLFIFAGGPGQAASETWVMMRPILDDVREKRDIVMIDQRGTGSSAPLDCPVPEDEEIDLENELDPERIAELTRECLDGLDGDPALYTTTIGMRDYDLVREAMGYERINLLGISYGTRSAQVYLRLFPERVRSAIFDSVVPMQLNLGAEHAPMLDRAVEKVLVDCAADTDCAERFPVGMDDLRGLVRSLRETPREIEFTHPLTGEIDRLVVTGDMLAVALRFLNYSSATQAVVPLLAHEALATGRLDRLAAQAMLVMGGLADTLSRGMELSVLCSEDHPFMGPPPDHDDTLLGGVMRQVLDVQCALWPKGEVSDDFHEPVRWDGPVLLMSGERDPVTPPAYAAQAAETFPRSANLVAPGLGHMVIKHRCLRGIASDFIAEPDVSRLETECVDDIEPSPFFTTLLGPEP